MLTKNARTLSLVLLAVLPLLAAQAARAENYALDTDHCSIYFRIQHAGVADVFGRFNEFNGNFTYDAANPTAASYALNINPASIDTNQRRRDDHLRSADFFDVKQFPAITFKSTSVQKTEGGLNVTGDLTMHGRTRPVTFQLTAMKATEFPAGVQRIGFNGTAVIKRSDFGVGIERFNAVLGDEVHVMLGIEGTVRP